MLKSNTIVSLVVVMTAVLSAACSSDSDKPGAGSGGSGTDSAGANSTETGGANGGSGGRATSKTGNSGGTTASVGGGAPGGSGGTAVIGTGTTACSNGLDDDGDGLVDGFDTECTGIADNDEGSFATGIPGDNRDATWQDCFFDGNSGAGDDGCRYHIDCLTDPTTTRDCSLTEACTAFCAPLTPNGCDCFGCCTIRLVNGSDVNVLTDAECSLDDISTCTTCSPSTVCGNTCGKCELCAGKTAQDLIDAGCTSRTCEGGAQLCGEAGMAVCPGSTFCLQGCCLSVPPLT